MSQFDPYHKWLGIPPEEQPPHHYRLLAISLFESDSDVIDSAADRQMAFLKQCATGPNVEHSQKLLNEVAAARLCLLKPDSKATYDSELKRKLAASRSVAPVGTHQETPSSVPYIDPAPGDGLTSILRNPSESSKPVQARKIAPSKGGTYHKQLLLMGSGVLGLLVLIVGLVFSLKSKTSGTLLVELNEPDAEVQVLDAHGRVEISRKSDKGPITILVDPGKHRLSVQKDGFSPFAKDFEIEAGGKKAITATLIWLEHKQAEAKQETNKQAMVPTSQTSSEQKPSGSDTPKPSDQRNSPAFRQWMREVASLSPEKQVEAVAKKLRELNPEFDGKVTGFDGNGTPKIENDVVTELHVLTNNVTNISPVRALVGLKALSCRGIGGNPSQFADLSPLNGMSLTTVDCSSTAVRDLSPLKGMSLTRLECSFSQVFDLLPLVGMPLTHLRFRNTGVFDLSLLKGMPLAELDCSGTNIADLSPLKGLPLERLNLSETAVSDLLPLKGMPLTHLFCIETQITDLSPLQELRQLSQLNCDRTPVADLSPLRGSPVEWLDCNGTKVTDLSPLHQCRRLRSLSVHQTKVTPEDLAAFQKAAPNCVVQ